MTFTSYCHRFCHYFSSNSSFNFPTTYFVNLLNVNFVFCFCISNLIFSNLIFSLFLIFSIISPQNALLYSLQLSLSKSNVATVLLSVFNCMYSFNQAFVRIVKFYLFQLDIQLSFEVSFHVLNKMVNFSIVLHNYFCLLNHILIITYINYLRLDKTCSFV